MKRAVLFDVGDTLILGHPKLWLWPLLLERGLTPDTSRLQEAIAAAYAEYNRRHLEAISPEAALPVWRTFHQRLLQGLGLQDHAEEISRYLAENWQNPKVWPITPGAEEVLAELKEDPDLRRIPVIVLTTSQAEEDIVRSYHAHANAYVAKPVDFEKFIAVVRRFEDFWLAVVRLPPKPEGK